MRTIVPWRVPKPFKPLLCDDCGKDNVLYCVNGVAFLCSDCDAERARLGREYRKLLDGLKEKK